MKIQKLAGLIKKRKYCVWVNCDAGSTFAGTASAMYRIPGMPHVKGETEIRTVLDIDRKTMEKVELKEAGARLEDCVAGFDFTGGQAPGEQGARRLEVAAAVGGKFFEALVCDDGELLFYDSDFLAPVMDVMKDEDGYITVCIRETDRGGKAVVVKNGIEVIAQIMPARILTPDYMEALADFVKECRAQIARIRWADKGKGEE